MQRLWLRLAAVLVCATAQTTCPADCSGRGACLSGACTCDAGWAGDDCALDVESIGRSPPPPPPRAFAGACAASSREAWVQIGSNATEQVDCAGAGLCAARPAQCSAQLALQAGATCSDARCFDGSCAPSGCAALPSCPAHAPKRCVDGSCLPLAAPCPFVDAHALCTSGRAPAGGRSDARWAAATGSWHADAALDGAALRLCADGQCVPVEQPCPSHDGCSPIADDSGHGSGHALVHGGERGVVRCDDGTCVGAAELAALGGAAMARCSVVHAAAGGSSSERADAIAAAAAAAAARTLQSPPRTSAARVLPASARVWLHAPVRLAELSAGAAAEIRARAPPGLLQALDSGSGGAGDALAAPARAELAVHADVLVGTGPAALTRASLGRVRFEGAAEPDGIGSLFVPEALARTAPLNASALDSASVRLLAASTLRVAAPPAPSELRAATRPRRWSSLRLRFEDALLSTPVAIEAPALRERGGGASAQALASAEGGVLLELAASSRAGGIAPTEPFSTDALSGFGVHICLGALLPLGGTLGAWRCVAPAAVVQAPPRWADGDGALIGTPVASSTVDGAPLEHALLRARIPALASRALALAFMAHDGSEPYASYAPASPPSSPPPPAPPAPPSPPAPSPPPRPAGPVHLTESEAWLIARLSGCLLLSLLACCLCLCCAHDARRRAKARADFWHTLLSALTPLSPSDVQDWRVRFGLGRRWQLALAATLPSQRLAAAHAHGTRGGMRRPRHDDDDDDDDTDDDDVDDAIYPIDPHSHSRRVAFASKLTRSASPSSTTASAAPPARTLSRWYSSRSSPAARSSSCRGNHGTTSTSMRNQQALVVEDVEA